MFLTEIYQPRKPKHAAFTFGRMNPPTIGHALLMNTVARAAKGGDYWIFLSSTQDKKNPLPYFEKIDFIQRMFPQHADHIVIDKNIRNPVDAMRWIYEHGYTDVTMVAGDDRLAKYKELLTTYNNSPDHWRFNTMRVVSSGPRDGDNELSNVSATKARGFAADNENPNASFAEFNKITGAKGQLALQLYQAVRQGMGVLGEDAAGVGVVATNKKMARDPRYSTSMTADVKTGTSLKNLKAFKLA